MKRLNPETNDIFKRGDVRHDGFVFFNYTAKLKADGYFLERWLSPTISEKRKAKDRANKKAKYQRKSQRHSPGFTELTPSLRAAINQIQRLDADQRQYNDMPIEEIAELLAENVLSAEQWDEVVAHSGPVCFDLKEAIRLALSM